jgi:uncharacterized protein YndB with AHSA1/START domain
MPNAPLLETAIEIDAPVDKVWGLIADLDNMPRWSPQTRKMLVRGPVQAGTKLVNFNRDGWKVWPTTGKLTAVEPNKKLAWYIKDNKSEWSYELEPTATGGTKVTERRVLGEERSALSTRMQGLVFGGTEYFDQVLLEGMRISLAKIKSAAEG